MQLDLERRAPRHVPSRGESAGNSTPTKSRGQVSYQCTRSEHSNTRSGNKEVLPREGNGHFDVWANKDIKGIKMWTVL